MGDLLSRRGADAHPNTDADADPDAGSFRNAGVERRSER